LEGPPFRLVEPRLRPGEEVEFAIQRTGGSIRLESGQSALL
jgi:hypothetical protein